MLSVKLCLSVFVPAAGVIISCVSKDCEIFDAQTFVDSGDFVRQIKQSLVVISYCLLCFDAVGWVTGKPSCL